MSDGSQATVLKINRNAEVFGSRVLPGRTVHEHGVEVYQQLAYKGGRSQLCRLAGRHGRWQKPLITGLKRRASTPMMGCGDPGPSTPYVALAPRGTTAPIEGSYAHPGSDLSAVESAQFGQVCQKGKRDLASDSGTLRSGSSSSRHTGLWRRVSRKRWSRSFSPCLSQAMWGRTAIAALERPLLSATSIVISWCLRPPMC